MQRFSFDEVLPTKVGVFNFSNLPSAAELAAENLDGGLFVDNRNLQAALADIDRLRDGWLPDTDVMERAPVLDRWSFRSGPAGIVARLSGEVADHPYLGSRVIVTSQLVAFDLDRTSWARTLSRFYRLRRAAI